MPHSSNEVGIYEIRVTVSAQSEPNLAYTDVLTVTIQESYLTQFRQSIERAEVRVGDTITQSLPAIYNPQDMEYNLEVVSMPAWASYRNGQFTF